MSSKRILFLFNHDAAHQAAHIAGIAGYLALHAPDIRVIVASGTETIRRTVAAIIPATAHENIEWITLTIPGSVARWLNPLNSIAPVLRLARLHYNVDLFSSVDMLVSTERTCLRVKRRLGVRAPCFVLVPHGSGDRNVTYHPDFANFDLMLLSGPKLVDEMVRHGITQAGKCRIIGYPKFDTIDLTVRKRFFDNDLPVFLYNPHFEPRLSSWYSMGAQVMDYFYRNQDRYNLIVAPHVMLFRKKVHYSLEYRMLKVRPDIDPKFLSAPNIRVDLDSPNLFDMSYTMAADAYIGDVSSQVYEFLLHRGACYFLDPLGPPEKGPAERYEFWRNGEVLYDPAELAAHIPQWRENAASHLAEQDRLFAYTMDYQPGRTASERGAEALANHLGVGLSTIARAAPAAQNQSAPR